MLGSPCGISVGTIVYIQDGLRPMGGDRFWFPSRRAPWMVEAWHNREYFPCSRSRPERTYMRGGHLATVRCLRTGRRRRVADWILKKSIECFE